MRDEPTIFVVDNDQAVREALRTLLESVGFQVADYPSAQAFLDDYHPGRSGCLVLDIRMPGLSGLELQEQLDKRVIHLPVVIISGHGDVPMAVQAMKNGAIDFLEKPFNDERFLTAVRQGVQVDTRRRRIQGERSRIATRLARLSGDERQVLTMLCEGKSNKEMAQTLEVGIKVLETHRAKLMEKMEVRSLAELVKTAVVAKLTD